jgi:flagellum-specific ATP synthase
VVAEARKSIAVYDDMAELIRLGAYKAGSNPEVDASIRLHPELENFLAQKKEERIVLTEGYQALGKILGLGPVGKGKSK